MARKKEEELQSQPTKTKPGAPAVATTVPSTDLKAAVTPTTAVPAVPVPGTPAPTPLATNPLLPAPAPPPPDFQATKIPTAAPQAIPISQAPNALTGPAGAFDQKLQESAQNYRDLVARNASPVERAVAKQDYANALNEKAIAARETATGLGQAGAMTASQAFGMPQREVSPAEQARIAHYREYLTERKGIDPYAIGGAQLVKREGGGHGLDIMSPEQEAKARAIVNEAAKRSREMMNAERVGRRSKTPEGMLAAQEQRVKRWQHDVESGLRNPMNPTAGMDTTNAMRVAGANELAKSSNSTLRGLAEKEKKVKEEPVEGKSELDLAAQRSREDRDRWWAEQLRRRAMLATGSLAPMYS